MSSMVSIARQDAEHAHTKSAPKSLQNTLHGKGALRVNSGMLNVIRIVTYYALPPVESPDSFWIAMAFSR